MITYNAAAPERVFHIRKLIHTIFSYCCDISTGPLHSGKSTLVNCACVCKLWSPTALDILWEDMDAWTTFMHLFVRPTYYSMSDIWLGWWFDYTLSDIVHDRILRFQFYSKRIKSIRYDGLDHMMKFTIKDPMKDFLMESPHLWSRLRSLHITIGDILQIPWFLFTPGVTKLTLSLHFLDFERQFVELFQLISKKLSCLIHLDLRRCTGFDMTVAEREVRALLKVFPSLRYIGLPYGWVTPRVASVLAALPLLEIVTQGDKPATYIPELGHQEEPHIEVDDEWGMERKFDPEFREGSFPRLRGFAFNGTIADAFRFIEHEFISSTLTELCIGDLEFGSLALLGEFMNSLAKRCPKLTSLRLDLYHPIADRSLIVPEKFRIFYDDTELFFDSLSAFHNLQCLDLRHPCSFAVDWDVLDRMAWNLPKLTHLNLNCFPTHDHHPIANFDALISFADNCPNLRVLSLIFSAFSDDVGYGEPVKFRNLEKLTVGFSELTNEYVAFFTKFLSEVVPAFCTIEGPPHIRGSWDVHPDSARNWKEVIRTVPLITRARFEEERKASSEILQLKQRIKLLEKEHGMNK